MNSASHDEFKKTKNFRVQQWDKNKISTFFLGNYLSCCLATNGSQFPAIVQRRMDNAMFMHVVIDENTGEPVCGNWLFFAKDSNDDNVVFVVANFFEIRSNYGSKTELRELLVSELIKFTGDFSQEINAKAFLMRPLTYGLIPDFSHYNYDKIQIKIEKVGGYLQLDYESEEASQKRYYLNAVDLDHFYIYQIKKACIAQPPSAQSNSFAFFQDNTIQEPITMNQERIFQLIG